MQKSISRRDFLKASTAASFLALTSKGSVISDVNPREKLPIALIVDDSVPCINPYYYHFTQVVKRKPDPAIPATISISLLEEFIACVQNEGVKGDFTVLPYPAGLGPITGRLEGCDDSELKKWLALARQHLVSQFDIHPEVLTHTRGLDLKTNQLHPDLPENIYMAKLPVEELTAYMTRAMTILKDAGLPANGITHPRSFKTKVEPWSRALLAAEKQVNNRKVTHCFIYADTESPYVAPSILYINQAEKEAVISVPNNTNDPFWDTNVRLCPEPGKLVAPLISEDGRNGRLVELFKNKSPMVIVTHWQSLAGNGTHAGMRGLEILAKRIREHLGDHVQWVKLSQMAEEKARRAFEG